MSCTYSVDRECHFWPSDWLMEANPRDELVSVLSMYPPGTMQTDRMGHYWIRRANMVITRHRFISSVGHDTEKYYQQKYLLNVPMTCWQSAISRGFHTDQLRSLAQLYIEHGFLSDEEADIFWSDIPVLGEHDEPEATVTDQMLPHTALERAWYMQSPCPVVNTGWYVRNISG